MADTAQLEAALINADKAGDVDAAQALAAEIGRVRGLSAAPTPSATNQATIGSRIAQGLRDPLDAGAQLLAHAMPEGLVSGVNKATQYVNDLPVIGPATKALGMTPAAPQQIDQGINDREKAYQASRQAAGNEGIDWARLGGNMLATAPIAAGLPAAAPSLAGRAALGATQGGVFGALQPVISDGKGDSFASEKAKQAMIGALIGGATVPVMSGIARMIKPNTSANVSTLLDAGITPTPGQILGGTFARTEEKLTSIPGLGDAIKSGQRRAIDQFNVAGYNRALEPLGLNAGSVAPQAGREGIAAVKTALGNAYDDLLPKMQFKADQQFASEINSLAGMVNNGNVPPKIATQFDNILRNNVFSRMTPQGAMDGRNFKTLEESLSKDIKGYIGSVDPDQRKLGEALSEVLTSARSALSRSNPQYAPQLKAINEGYANFARLRSAGASLGAQDGIFTPAQLQNAVKAGDKSAGKGSFATGNALMQDLSEAGKNVLSQKYPDSGTAGRLLIGSLGGGALGGGVASGLINPVIPALMAGGATAYTPMGQKIAAALLAKRPDFAEPVADAVRGISPYVGPLLYGMANSPQ